MSLVLIGAATAASGNRVHASSAMEERKLPMRFAWHDAQPSDCSADCRGWVTAVGVIDADSVHLFDELASAHDMRGVTVVLDSGGGSVLDAISLGRRWRELKISTAVGTAVKIPASSGTPAHIEIFPNAYCESMCVFLLLSGVQRYVPAEAHIRVHQIWMGDRADDAQAAKYSAEDVTIIERDVGRLAQYTFDMGGSGELLGLALSVPPWDSLRQLSTDELHRTNIVNTEFLSDVLPGAAMTSVPAVAAVTAQKPFHERVTPGATRTAEVKSPAGGASLGSEGK